MDKFIQVAKLVCSCGRIEGRVKFQKIVHILKEMGYPFREEFGYLHHGPYSSDLKREIDQLVSWELISEENDPVRDYPRFSYAASEAVDDILVQLDETAESDWQQAATELNRKSARELEGISTVMFLRRNDFDGVRLERRFKELKPHLESLFGSCLKEAEHLQRL